MMKKLFKALAIISTLSLVLGAILVCGFSASAADVTVWEGTIDQDFATSGSGWAPIAIDEITQAIRDDVANNGIPSKVTIQATASYVSGPNGYTVFAFLTESPVYCEAWADKGSTYENTTFTSAKDLATFGAKTQLGFFSDPGGNDITHLTSMKIIFTHEGGTTSSTVSETSTVSEDSTVSETSTVSEDSTISETSTPADVILGDANGDKSIDMKDVLAIRKFIAGMTITGNFVEAASDYNGDHSVDMKDVLAIRKYIASN